MKPKTMNFCKGINLKAIMSNEQGICPGLCYKGTLSVNDEGQYLFEEAVPVDRHGKRNPKLFQGEYISLVHMQNGKYQCHCRTINVHKVSNPAELAACVYNELLKAFTIIDMAASAEQSLMSTEPKESPTPLTYNL